MNPNMLLMALGAVIAVILVVMFINSGSELLEKMVTDDHIDTGLNSLLASESMGKCSAYWQGGHTDGCHNKLTGPRVVKDVNPYSYATTYYSTPSTEPAASLLSNQNTYGSTKFIKQLESDQGNIIAGLSTLREGVVRPTQPPVTAQSMFAQPA